MKIAAYRSVTLFQKHPQLLVHIPMFYDKTPISWRQDTPLLIGRKLVRVLLSSRLVLRSMEQIVNALEKRSPTSSMLPTLYRYITGWLYISGLSSRTGRIRTGR